MNAFYTCRQTYMNNKVTKMYFLAQVKLTKVLDTGKQFTERQMRKM